MKLIDTSKAWFVVRTNIKCERKASDNLHRAGFDVYYPRKRVEKRNPRHHTYRIEERPLLLRYLFVGMTAPHYGFVRACEGVEGILGEDFQGKPCQVPSKWLVDFQGREMSLEFDDTRAARIARKEEARTRRETVAMKHPKGARRTVSEGPFAYFSGEVVGTTGGEVELLLSIFGRMVPVRLEEKQLEKVA
jgi:transcription termination/antitermination protein NusG